MLQLGLRGDKPIYEQIVEQVKYHVIKGHLQPHEPIPSVRKLALELGITPGTVARAYQELEAAHIIETIKGKGTFIAEKPESGQNEEKLEEVRRKMTACILELKMMGMENDAVVQMVLEACRGLEEAGEEGEDHD